MKGGGVRESIRKLSKEMFDARERDDRGAAMAPRLGVARHLLKMLELHRPTAPLREHRAHLSELEDPEGAKVDDMDYCETTTGQSPTVPGKSTDDWMVHFVTARDPHDRGFYAHEAGIDLPADGELSRNADEFEVLCSQMRLGGLIPGFPDAMKRLYSPKSTIIAQDVTRVDFAKRSSRCGVVFRRSEFVDAGASDGVIPGRPDLWFDDLLAWDTNNISAEVVRFRAPDGMGGALGLPLYIPRSPFTAIGVLVDDEEQAFLIGAMLTKRYLGLKQYEPAFRYVRSQLRRTLVMWEPDCGDLDLSWCTIPGLQNFKQRAAVIPTADSVRHKVIVDRAIAGARSAAGKYFGRPEVWWPEPHRKMFIEFKPGSDPISEFLTFNNLVEPADDGEDIGRYRFDLGIESWCGPKDQRAMFEAAAETLEHRLGLGFTVRAYLE